MTTKVRSSLPGNRRPRARIDAEHLEEVSAQDRLRTVVLATFAVAALSLACLGVYATLAYAPARHAHVVRSHALSSWMHLPVHQTFTLALEALVEQIKGDRAILAALLCGSLSHDTVWTRSDIDLVLVTVDDRKIETTHIALDADGVNVHACLMPRAEFRKAVEGTAHNSFFHSFLAKGRLLYTHDPTIEDLCARLHVIGERDTQRQLLHAGICALPPIDKAHKWFVTRGDLHYTALWILYAATPLARIEIMSRGLLTDREVLPQAMTLNPDFFRTIYADLLDAKKTKARVQAALDAVDGYVAARAPALFAPVIDYLREAGDVRSSSDVETHFMRHAGVEGTTIACEYLADRGLIAKAATSVRLTRRSTSDVQELAFFSTDSGRA